MPQTCPPKKRGFLVVFEGIDRSGKSTQARMMYDHLIREGHAAELFRFPDRSTTVGGILNSYLEAQDCRSCLWPPQLLHLLFSANRWEAQPKLYEALNRGAVVIVDRYSFSGVAYSTGAAPATALATANNLKRPSAASAATAAIAAKSLSTSCLFPTAESSSTPPSASPSSEAVDPAAAAAVASVPITIDFCLKTEEGLLAPDLVIYLDMPPREAHLRTGFGSELYEKVGIQEKVHAAYERFQSLPYWRSIAAGHNATAADLHEKIYHTFKEVFSSLKNAEAELRFSRKLLWDA